MGSTEASHPTKDSAADSLSKAIGKNETSLLARDTWAPPAKKDAAKPTTGTPEVAHAQGAKPQDAKVASAPEQFPLKLADAHSDSVHQAVITEEKNISSRISHNIELAQKGTFAVGDILKNFDALYDHASQLNLQGIYTDYTAIKNDPNQKQAADAEATLLHAPGVILANKALVAYDAAFKPNADATHPNKHELITIARQSIAAADQDAAVKQHFAPQVQKYEALIKQYGLDGTAPAAAPAEKPVSPAPVAPADRTPAPAAPADKTPPPAAPSDTSAPVPPKANVPTDQELAAAAKAAKDHEPAKAALEAQLWGSAADPKNLAKYADAKASIFNVTNGMDNYTEQQRVDFQTKLFGAGSVTDKQHYVDQFAAKDKTLHDSATELIQLAGDKLPTLANWSDQERYATAACNAFYAKALASDAAGKTQEALGEWQKAQKYPLEATFLGQLVKDPHVLRLDAKMSGDSDDLFTVGKQYQAAGDMKSAEGFYRDAVQAADIKAQTQGVADKKNVDDAHAKLANGALLSSDEKLAIAAGAFTSARNLTNAIETRNNAAAALSGLGNDKTGAFTSSPDGKKYQAEIGQWLRESTAMSKNVDTAGIKIIGDTLAGAAANNITLRKPGQEKNLQQVSMESQTLLGVNIPTTKAADGTIKPGFHLAGSADVAFTSPKLLAAYMVTQGHGTEAIAALKEAALRESTIKGWDLKDSGANDPQIGKLMLQARPLDSQRQLDALTRSESMWKTPLQALGGFAAFTAAVYLTKNASFLEDLAPGLEKEGVLAATARTTIKFAPQLAGTVAAVGTSYGVDRLGHTHEGLGASALKGMSVVALVKGGKYMSRIGATGLAPNVAENVFGAGTAGGELSASKVLGRMVTDMSGKPLAESEVTAGKLAEHLEGKVSTANLAKLKALPEDMPLFDKKGTINPKVNEAFLGSSQRELAQTLQQSLGKTGRFIPTAAEVKGLVKGTAIDVSEGDANTINRQLTLRSLATKPLAGGGAHLATEKGVLQRVAMEVSGTDKVGESTLTREQLLDYAKARNVPTKDMGKIASVVGEDAPILTGGKFNKALGTIDSGTQTELRAIAKANGKAGNLTTAQLINYANKNEVPLAKFEGLMNQDPVLIRNGQWNPDLLIKDAKTGAVARAIDTPNFKGVMGLDHLDNTRLYSSLAKRGAGEKTVLERLAERSSKQVIADDAGNITKKDYVDRLLQSGKTPEEIAAKYPNLSKINDEDLIVKGGKYQAKITQRDLPENLTKAEFIDSYKAKTGTDLRDPEQLAKSPWRKAIGAASDDALVIKNGDWQVNRFRLPKEAKTLVNERTIDIGKPKAVGLTETKGKFLMTDVKASMNAGQLLSIMKDAKLDPSKLEALEKMNPTAPIVVDGKLVKAPVAEMSPTSKVFTLAKGKYLSFGMSEGQKAVLSGEAIDGEINTGLNWKADGALRTSGKAVAGFAKSLVPNVKAMAVTARDTKLGFGIYGSVDPLEGTFAQQGARYNLQNFAYGTAGVFGSYSLYQGMQTFGHNNYDKWGDQISSGEALKENIFGSPDMSKTDAAVKAQLDAQLKALTPADRATITDDMYQQELAARVKIAEAQRATDASTLDKAKAAGWKNFWMPQFYSSFQDVAKFPTQPFIFTAALPLGSSLISGGLNAYKGGEAQQVQNYNDALSRNNAPLMNHPEIDDSPAAAATVAPTDAPAAPAAAPAPSPDDLSPNATPLKPSSVESNVQRLAPGRQVETPNVQPVRQPAAAPKATAPTGDYIDNSL